MIGTARGNPRLQMLAEFRPACLGKILNLYFHEMPPIANGALHGYLGTMVHVLAHSQQLTANSSDNVLH
jgi:hypothetical protein